MKKKSLTFFLLILICSSVEVHAQYKKGAYYYNNFQYSKAIKEFEKVVSKKNPPPVVFENLADCYRFTKNYSKAETMYAKAIQTGKETPIAHFYYAEILKTNKKYDEAKKQYAIYSGFLPDDKGLEEKVRSVDEARVLLNKDPQYNISNVKDINSPYSEFSPVIFKNGLVFTAERNQDLVNFENYQWNGSPFLNLFFSEKKNSNDSISFKSPAGISKQINSDAHEGPATFSADNTLVFFTRVSNKTKKDKSFVNRAKIFSSEFKNGSWSTPKPFYLNSDNYSVAHPSLSADGNFLFFSSDMSGGYGRKDIYVCSKEGDGWGKAVNLGPSVNTFGDEVFPYISSQGALYFSSDGLPGIGGLDIFRAEKQGDKWTNIVNMGAPVNSSTDDFGIALYPDGRTGYFSSDRPGGKGSDDIYKFTSNEQYIVLAGKILLSKRLNDPARNTRVFLLKEGDGRILKTSFTDSSGYFRFENLSAQEKYFVKIDEEDPAFVGRKRAFLTDEKNKIIRVTVFNEKGGRFVFQNLPADPNSLSQVSVDENINISGNLFLGDDRSKPLSNTKVNLLDDKGNIVQTVSTNAFGAFVFSDLPPDESFIVKVEESNVPLSSNLNIVMTNKKGKVMDKTTAGKKGDFKFSLLVTKADALEQMEVEESELLYDMTGKIITENKKNVNGLKLLLLNEKGEIIRTVSTDDSGNFVFSRLPANQNFLLKADENDPKLTGMEKLFLADEKGKVMKEIDIKTGKYIFNILPSEFTSLGQLYVDDPWLKVLAFSDERKNKDGAEGKENALPANHFSGAITITENIYYDIASWKLYPYGEMVLDKLIGLMRDDPHLKVQISSHTDSKDNAKFNQELSEKRAKTAVDYIVAAGIDIKRISGKGYGETRLINRCKDGVECTEEEHAKNRRTEFKLIRQ